MRRLVLFLVLFLGGLTVLYFVQRRRERPLPTESPSSEIAPGTTGFTDVPLPPEPDGSDRGKIGIYFRGPFRVREIAGTGEFRRSIEAGNVEPLGSDLYDFHDLVIEIRDRESDALVARLTSPRSRLRVPLVDGKPALSEDEPVQFSNAEITLHRGPPIVPVTLRAAELAWQPAQSRFFSNERVQISGAGLEAESTGFDASSADPSISLHRRGVIRLALPDRGILTLAATGEGAITIAREAEGSEEPDEAGEQKEQEGRDRPDRAGAPTGPITVRVQDGARLALSDAELEITARDLTLRGRADAEKTSFEPVAMQAEGDVRARSGTDRFEAARASCEFGPQGRLTAAELAGAVLLQSATDVFHAEEARFRFDAGGALARADLRGEPNGVVEIGRYLPAVAPRASERLSARARIAGAGPLAVEFGERTDLELAGPGTLAVPELDLSLAFTRSLHGAIETRAQRGELSAEGAVEVAYRGDRMASEALAIQYALDANGAAVVDGQTQGSTTVAWQLEGRALALEARGGLDVHVQAGILFVPIAREVDVSLAGAKGFRARAARILDLDWQNESFRAEGDVEFEDANGRGRAARAERRGPDDHALFGGADGPARYELVRAQAGQPEVQISAQAQSIEVHGDELDAAGDVRTELGTVDGRYELESDRLHVELDPEPPESPGPPGPSSEPAPARGLRLRADGQVSARFESPEGRSAIASEQLEIDGTIRGPIRGAIAGAQDARLEVGAVRAEGDVRIDYFAETVVRGSGDRLTIDAARHGRLTAESGRRVRAVVQLAAQPPYAIEADWIDFGPDHVEAANVSVDLETREAPPELQDEDAPLLLEIKADRFRTDREGLRLEGNAYVRGRTPQGEPWTVEAGTIEVAGGWTDAGRFSVDALKSVRASGGFRAALGERVRASGELLQGDPSRLRIEGRPAILEYRDAVWESAWIQYDVDDMLLATDSGRMRSRDEDSPSSWTISYASMQPFPGKEEDTTILVLQSPEFRQGASVMRAEWLLFWVDRAEWTRSSEVAIKEGLEGPDLRITSPDAPASSASPATPRVDRGDPTAQWAALRNHPLVRVLGEVYVEGNIEVLEAQERKARAESLYIDLVDGRGWVQQADVLVDVEIRNRPQRLRAKAKWMRIGADGTLRAANAVLTACEYDEPHYRIETGDLRLQWLPGKGLGFGVSARSNELRFHSGFAIPLPPLVYEEDEEGNSFIENVIAGNTPRFGTSIRANFNVALGGFGRGLGAFFGNLFDFPETSLRGRWTFDAGYLGSRGLLLGTGVEYEVKDDAGRDLFRLDAEISGILDDEDDKGLVRVPPDDRDSLRNWVRARGRYNVGRREWYDLALSRQSDPGVQSEFFERDYLNYEQKDNYLHWRKAVDENYFSASAKVLLEDRTDTEELPALGFFHGRTPIGTIGTLPVLYRASADFAYLRRYESDETFDGRPPPGYKPYPDGLGDREVVRFDTEHRLEAPFPVGFAAIRATPWLAARGTVWSESVDPDEAAAQAGLLAGLDFATTAWRRYPNGSIHALSPVLGLRTDLVVEETDERPVTFDATEEPIEGTVVDLGLRSRWWRPATKERFDLEVRASHASSLPEGEDEGLQPIAVLAELLTFAGSVPVGLSHDGRYDVDDDGTIYSRSAIGFEPHRRLGLEFGYHRGLHDNGTTLYEAASFAARWRATRKWEFELSQTISLLDDDSLEHELVLRRNGHDFILEIEVDYRAGEGTGFNIGVTPELSWKRSGLGLIDNELGVDR